MYACRQCRKAIHPKEHCVRMVGFDFLSFLKMLLNISLFKIFFKKIKGQYQNLYQQRNESPVPRTKASIKWLLCKRWTGFWGVANCCWSCRMARQPSVTQQMWTCCLVLHGALSGWNLTRSTNKRRHPMGQNRE